MKKCRLIFVTLLFTLIYGVSQAQIKFEKISHDFGEIAEDGGVVEHIFPFRNTSSHPVVVVSTHSSCGCTKAEFSRKPVMPDSVSHIKVIFNPMNYPGAFARKVTIVTASGVVDDRLLVTGTVTPRKRSIEERYPILLGEGVRVAANAHNFGYVEHGKMKQTTFDIVNTSAKSVSLRLESPYSELEFYYPAQIAPGEEVAINVGCLLADNSAIYGSLAYSVYLTVNGRKAQYPFIINGLAIDSREENANNAQQMIALSEKFIKFGAVKCDAQKLVRLVEVRNDGSRPLKIRKLELDGEGFYVGFEGDTTLQQGEKRVITIEIDPSRLPFGAVVERLRIVSNDPKMPVYSLRVSAIVER